MQAKIARRLKYETHEPDLKRLEAELSQDTAEPEHRWSADRVEDDAPEEPGARGHFPVGHA
jgi:hypothetical protein